MVTRATIPRSARGVDLAHAAQHALGLRLREPVSVRLAARRPDLALNAPTSSVPYQDANQDRPTTRNVPVPYARRPGLPFVAVIGAAGRSPKLVHGWYTADQSANRGPGGRAHVLFMYHFDRIVPDPTDRKARQIRRFGPYKTHLNPAGGRAVAGSNPVSPITSNRQFCWGFPASAIATTRATGNKRGTSSRFRRSAVCRAGSALGSGLTRWRARRSSFRPMPGGGWVISSFLADVLPRLGGLA